MVKSFGKIGVAVATALFVLTIGSSAALAANDKCKGKPSDPPECAAVSVPEPGSFPTLGLALVGLGLAARRLRR